MTDPFDDFLDSNFSCDANDALQSALRQKTTHLLRRRRRLRYLAVAGMAAACYVAGLATMWLLPPRTVTIIQEPAAGLAKAEPENPAPQPDRPEVHEMLAQANPDQRSTQLRIAGDLYLQQRQDYAAALRCYTASLDAGGPAALEVQPEDSWLVKAIKKDRRKGEKP